MLVLKIALGVFVGALGALLAYDALSVYQIKRLSSYRPTDATVDLVSARFHERRVLDPDQARALALGVPAKPASTAGVIEWTGNPGSRVTVPR